MKKICFFDSKPYDISHFESENREYGFQITFIKSHLTHDTVKLAEGFDAVCAFVNDKIDHTIIDRLIHYGIKILALRSAGYNNVDIRYAFKKIHIVRVPSYSPHSIAEHTMALLLSLNRNIHKAYLRTREGNFNINGLQGFDLHSKTAGVIGTGKIGLALIQILKGFGMRILAYDRYPNQAWGPEYGFTYCDLDTLYGASDVITLHCPLTPETYHMINVESLNKMKRGVFIINTGRGKLIDSKALIDALKQRKIGAAGLDVYEEEEEYFFEDFSNEVIDDDVLARLLTFNNVLITSHQGFFTEDALMNIAKTTLRSLDDYFKGGRLENEICYRCSEYKKDCHRTEKGRCF